MGMQSKYTKFAERKRCPSCGQDHPMESFLGKVNNEIIHFCKMECRTFYFSVIPTQNNYGEK